MSSAKTTSNKTRILDLASRKKAKPVVNKIPATEYSLKIESEVNTAEAIRTISDAVTHVKVMKHCLYYFALAHGIMKPTYINLVDYESKTEHADWHILNELPSVNANMPVEEHDPVEETNDEKCLEPTLFSGYSVIECRESQLKHVEAHQAVRIIVVHRDSVSSSITLNPANARIYIVVGETGIPNTGNLKHGVTVYISRLPPHLPAMFGEYRNGNLLVSTNYNFNSIGNEEYAKVYEKLKESGIYVNRRIEKDDNTKFMAKTLIHHSNLSDLSSEQEHTDKSITLLRLNEGSCSIVHGSGLFIIRGKRYKKSSSLKRIIENGPVSTYQSNQIAFFFQDMTNDELREIEVNRYYFGKDTDPSTVPFEPLRQYLNERSLFTGESGRILDKLCAEHKVSKEVFISLVDNCVHDYIGDLPHSHNGLFQNMMLQSNFFVPIIMNKIDIYLYQYGEKRRKDLLSSSYIDEPYIREYLTIDMNKALRHNRYLNRELHEERDRILHLIDQGKVVTESDKRKEAEFVTKFGQNFIRLFEVEKQTHSFTAKICLDVTSSCYVKNVETLLVDFNADSTVYIEDCVFVVIRKTDFAGELNVMGNVHTILNLNPAVTVKFNNFGKHKNTIAALISEQGNVSDFYNCYTLNDPMKLLDAYDEETVITSDQINAVNSSSDSDSSPGVPPIFYKAAVKYFLYPDGYKLDASISIAEVEYTGVLEE